MRVGEKGTSPIGWQSSVLRSPLGLFLPDPHSPEHGDAYRWADALQGLPQPRFGANPSEGLKDGG